MHIPLSEINYSTPPGFCILWIHASIGEIHLLARFLPRNSFALTIAVGKPDLP
jgi:hypothetical protein